MSDDKTEATQEAEETTPIAAQSFFDCDGRESWLDAVEALPGGYVPERGKPLPAPARASDVLLPARSFIITPDTELSSMFLIEGERGCHRECTFCVMRRSTNGGMRLVRPDSILDLIPEHATKVGLVGAAISDHPQLVELLEAIHTSGRSVSVSSLRADRLARRPRIAEIMRASGARSLTTASDAATETLRKTLRKGATEALLETVAAQAGSLGFQRLKIYMMLGVPGEEDEDMDELIACTNHLARHLPIALGVAPFVSKRMTPLDKLPFAGISVIERRVKRLQKGLDRRRAEVRPTSARWAWVEYQLAQGDAEVGEAAAKAILAGGRFAHYRKALAEIGKKV